MNYQFKICNGLESLMSFSLQLKSQCHDRVDNWRCRLCESLNQEKRQGCKLLQVEVVEVVKALKVVVDFVFLGEVWCMLVELFPMWKFDFHPDLHRFLWRWPSWYDGDLLKKI